MEKSINQSVITLEGLLKGHFKICKDSAALRCTLAVFGRF